MANAAIELKNITKTFGSVVANKNVSLTVNRGEILSVLGENGSGKTTLMNMISGIYFPDDGQIFVDGEEVVIRSPKDAYDLKIGMIHQHFKLVDVFTAAENIVLGLKKDTKFDMKSVEKKVAEISGISLAKACLITKNFNENLLRSFIFSETFGKTKSTESNALKRPIIEKNAI